MAAELVWRYVERVREARAEGEAVELSRAELAQLVETLDLAARVPDALEAPESAARRTAVRRRLDETVSSAGPIRSERVVVAAEPPRSRPLVAAWMFRTALAAAVALSVALVTVNQWHHSAAVVRRIRVPVNEAEINVQPVPEGEVHELLPRLVRNELEPQEERNLMWHMLVCRGCFNQYVQLKHTNQTASEVREELVRLVQR